MKYFTHIVFLLCWLFLQQNNAGAQSLVMREASAASMDIAGATIIVDRDDHEVVHRVSQMLLDDLQAITGRVNLHTSSIVAAETVIIIGSLDRSVIIREMVRDGILSTVIKGQWEAYQIQTVKNPFKGVKQALVIMGSDRRGTAFGVLELSKQMGISPWHWWADVPVTKKKNIFIDTKKLLSDAPKVKYRGIFINDEAPALSSWAREQFGGFNHRFYEKVFQLMLRLKANYIWPAMWGSAFYDDDSLNIKVADQYAIVVGTSHHEPMMRAHDEWRRYHKGAPWNYTTNKATLQSFWAKGMQRAGNEKIVTIGMRGDGDEPMTEQTATGLLENIVQDQREIITSETGMPASETPQLWALYKEVQDYYDKGMRVPDDVTLLLCDDNWGNLRRLPSLKEKPRKGGYGIYYHFDYVGGPRNYKWINTNQVERVWEQMHLAWQHKAREIWIVNVGDIKPMEFPISFFLDYAWNPEALSAAQLPAYYINWARQQFGADHAAAIAGILQQQTKFAARCKPELLDENTYSLHHYNEWKTVVDEYVALLAHTQSVYEKIPAAAKDAYYQLVLHPVKALCNLYQMYYYVALNKDAYSNKSVLTNEYAKKVKEYYIKDSLITLEYHRINNGKWHHIMSQTHIGYTYWQQPERQVMPGVFYLEDPAVVHTPIKPPQKSIKREKRVSNASPALANSFFEKDQYVSIQADHYSRKHETGNAAWVVISNLGKTGAAITLMSFNDKDTSLTDFKYFEGAIAQGYFIEGNYLEYAITTTSSGACEIQTFFSPTLNFLNTATGLQYAIAIDDEMPQVVSINKEMVDSKTWESWVANNIIIKKSGHSISKAGKHIVKFWALHPGVVLQKLVLDFGGMKASFLGPPETKNE